MADTQRIDDFEVSIFLTDLSSRHSVLTKQKLFKDKPRIQSNSGKLTGWLTTETNDQPVVIVETEPEPIILREDDDDEVIHLDDIPEAAGVDEPARQSNSNKRRRRATDDKAASDGSDTDDSSQLEAALSMKQSRTTERLASDAGSDEDGREARDDKKKLGLNTSYDGFSIYGRILCLVVKRKGPRTGVGGSAVPVSSQQMLETWVSTQAAAEHVDDEDDNG